MCIRDRFINSLGVLKTDSFSRPAGHHTWEGTLAYRVEQVEMTQVIYIDDDSFGTPERWPSDTHRITFTKNQDGDVIACKMERLK